MHPPDRSRTLTWRLRILLMLGLTVPPAWAQDAQRGARLYLGLPEGQPSCVECHGPDPGLNRNRLLNGAQGPAAIRQAIAHAAAMGYLEALLDAAALADLSAWLAQVNAAAQGDAPAEVWPWGLEFGRLTPGMAPAAQAVVLLNTGASGLPLQPRLQATSPGGDAGLSLRHDCPAVLAPGARCTATVGLDTRQAGRVQAALAWGDAALRPVGISAWVQGQPVGEAAWPDDAGQPWSVTLPAGQARVVERSVRNTGPAPLTLGVPAITGPGRGAFQVAAGGCGAGLTLAPGEACMLRLQFTATGAGPQAAWLQWRNDGAHLAPRALELRADGQPAAGPAPDPAPPPAGGAVTPPTPVAPTPPVAGPTPALDTGGGGGCRQALTAVRPDPLLPGLTLWAAWALWQRRRAVAVGSGRAAAPWPDVPGGPRPVGLAERA